MAAGEPRRPGDQTIARAPAYGCGPDTGPSVGRDPRARGRAGVDHPPVEGGELLGAALPAEPSPARSRPAATSRARSPASASTCDNPSARAAWSPAGTSSGGVARDLRQRSGVAAHHRHARRHRLERGQAEPLVHAGVGQHGGTGEQVGAGGVVDPARRHDAARGGGRRPRRRRRPLPPSPAARPRPAGSRRCRRPRHRRLPPRRRTPHQVDQPLAGLDGAQRQHVAVPAGHGPAALGVAPAGGGVESEVDGDDPLAVRRRGPEPGAHLVGDERAVGVDPGAVAATRSRSAGGRRACRRCTARGSAPASGRGRSTRRAARRVGGTTKLVPWTRSTAPVNHSIGGHDDRAHTARTGRAGSGRSHGAHLGGHVGREPVPSPPGERRSRPGRRRPAGQVLGQPAVNTPTPVGWPSSGVRSRATRAGEACLRDAARGRRGADDQWRAGSRPRPDPPAHVGGGTEAEAVELGLDVGPHGHPALHAQQREPDADLDALPCIGGTLVHGTGPPTRPAAEARR